MPPAGQSPSAPEPVGRVGVYLVGAAGNVATTTALGLASLKRGLRATTGLVTELPELCTSNLAGFADLALGGCDVAEPDARAAAQRLAAQGCVPLELVDAVLGDLEALTHEVDDGIATGEAVDLDSLVERYRSFAQRVGADRVVVVNLASTEPVYPGLQELTSEDALRDGASHGELPPSVSYAAAALLAGAGYVNFTPSAGACFPAADELCAESGAVHCGRDGKTGETLLKAALLPLFADRHLRVLSWFGQNILGNPDGATLRDAGSRAAKQTSKSGLVQGILGYQPEAQVNIDFVESLGDWKVAWDHIHFEGFLGTRMSLDLTWRGADSILAAPLIIDLVRLVDWALRRGQRGALGELSFFFKDPIDSQDHRLDRQFHRLVESLQS